MYLVHDTNHYINTRNLCYSLTFSRRFASSPPPSLPHRGPTEMPTRRLHTRESSLARVLAPILPGEKNCRRTDRRTSRNRSSCLVSRRLHRNQSGLYKPRPGPSSMLCCPIAGRWVMLILTWTRSWSTAAWPQGMRGWKECV